METCPFCGHGEHEHRPSGCWGGLAQLMAGQRERFCPCPAEPHPVHDDDGIGTCWCRTNG